MMRAWAFCIALAAGCTCDGSDEPRLRARARDEARPLESPVTSGGDSSSEQGPANALGTADPEVPASRFEVAPVSEAAREMRARGWASIADVRDGVPARRAPGNWLCRLWTHYGPPSEARPDGFRYVLRDRETGLVITAYSDAGGPALGGVIHGSDGLPLPGAQERVAALVNGLARAMDATIPGDCALEIRRSGELHLVGVRGGQWFEDRI